MKYFIGLLFALVHLNVWAQVKGNKEIVTQTFPLHNITSIDMNLYANVEVDCSAKEGLTIIADANLIDLIGKSVDSGQLNLTQKEWIKPSQDIKVLIGAPNLERVQLSVHETVIIENIERKNFNAMALIGKLLLKGSVEELFVGGEMGEIDAKELSTTSVDINLWSRGRIKLASPNEITGTVKDDGYVMYSSNQTNQKVRTLNGGRIVNTLDKKDESKFNTKFIAFRVKNNSFNRINCYVKGRKPDGNYFSYGFLMMPGQVRKKNWPIGSKVYRMTAIGTKKLLTEIKASDEGEVVKLY